jgi:hypothetical protein
VHRQQHGDLPVRTTEVLVPTRRLLLKGVLLVVYMLQLGAPGEEHPHAQNYVALCTCKMRIKEFSFHLRNAMDYY